MINTRRAFLFLVVLGVFSPLCTADDRDRFEYVAGTGIEIRSNPNGAKVFIDGIERGVTPFFSDALPAETYKIILRKETYPDREFEVVILSGSRLVITAEIETGFGYVDISVRKEAGSPDFLPFNPQINARASDKTMNSISLSGSNTASARLPAGNLTVHARAFGWENAFVTVSVTKQETTAAEIFMKPAAFKIEKASQSRKRFNPLNSGSLGVNEYRFEVTAPGSGAIKILDSAGNTVYAKQLERFDTWVQEMTWNGADSDGEMLPQGYYTVVIEATPSAQFFPDETETFSLKLKTEINYSANIFPLSLGSGVAGLAFSPMPHTLSAGSFSVDSGILFFKDDNTGAGFPFKLNLRVAPLERFELTTAFNINPYIGHEIGWGACGSVKYNFFGGSASVPLSFSAAVSYSWASAARGGASGEHPLSPGKGAGFYVPLSLELDRFSFVFCPAAFWYGPEGIIPELLLGAGVMYRGALFNAGVSARYEFDFNGSGNRGLLTGAEITFSPAPSNIFYSVQGGFWSRDSGAGFYAGLGIGLIY